MVEHSQAVSTAAAAIVGLINASPRSPTQVQIEAVLAKMQPTYAAPAADEPKITGPVQIEFDAADFVEYWLPIAQMAVKLLGKDKAGMRRTARRMFKGECDGVLGENAFHRFVDELETLEGKLGALAHVVGAARGRCLLAICEEYEAVEGKTAGEPDEPAEPSDALSQWDARVRQFLHDMEGASEFAVRTRTGTVLVCDVAHQRIQEIRDI